MDGIVLLVFAGALMHELEAILHEYLSFNWDRMEEMNTANAPLQRKEGLACPWRPSRDIDHTVSILLKAVAFPAEARKFYCSHN